MPQWQSLEFARRLAEHYHYSDGSLPCEPRDTTSSTEPMVEAKDKTLLHARPSRSPSQTFEADIEKRNAFLVCEGADVGVARVICSTIFANGVAHALHFKDEAITKAGYLVEGDVHNPQPSEDYSDTVNDSVGSSAPPSRAHDEQLSQNLFKQGMCAWYMNGATSQVCI